MRTFTSYLRVLLILTVVFILAEYFIDSGDIPAFIKYPEVALFLGLFVVLLIGLEIMIAAMNSITQAISPQKDLAQEKEHEFAWFKKIVDKLMDSTPLEKEAEVIMDHNYDGIQELDNTLPPWWKYGFYASIVFAIIYLVRFEILGADNQYVELEKEVAAATIAIEEYKKTAKDLIDADNVVLLTEASDLKAGEGIYNTLCVACHRMDGGGGIGPNLTDEYWILGGGIKNIFNTISEGGRSGKGMVSWKQSLKPSEIQQVASYVMSLSANNPVDGKDPEGEIWNDDSAAIE
ncbi:cbb3-type cytochrome c oxidase N-terminal domain-containing protein [Galbibacter sp.]|uniref:cbb3-type cytochrome c oxidase N-terminal domain-containing protein n=1 Tax=Galbibacter sp. TaxID=2918471 RepID=UPI002CC93B9E|nr:cbb3-type cytochrome c oxidase N-terminal domain-containing protein [Galbibacter sp.]HLV62867.1 cbb3-type cytochrome c oxidase N-terminal domain-containing protein [Galbibacter sp.]